MVQRRRNELPPLRDPRTIGRRHKTNTNINRETPNRNGSMSTTRNGGQPSRPPHRSVPNDRSTVSNNRIAQQGRKDSTQNVRNRREIPISRSQPLVPNNPKPDPTEKKKTQKTSTKVFNSTQREKSLGIRKNKEEKAVDNNHPNSRIESLKAKSLSESKKKVTPNDVAKMTSISGSIPVVKPTSKESVSSKVTDKSTNRGYNKKIASNKANSESLKIVEDLKDSGKDNVVEDKVLNFDLSKRNNVKEPEVDFNESKPSNSRALREKTLKNTPLRTRLSKKGTTGNSDEVGNTRVHKPIAQTSAQEDSVDSITSKIGSSKTPVNSSQGESSSATKRLLRKENRKDKAASKDKNVSKDNESNNTSEENNKYSQDNIEIKNKDKIIVPKNAKTKKNSFWSIAIGTWLAIIAIATAGLFMYLTTWWNETSLEKANSIAYQEGYNNAFSQPDFSNIVRNTPEEINKIILDTPGNGYPMNALLSDHELIGWTVPGGNESHGRATVAICYKGDGVTDVLQSYVYLVSDNAGSHKPRWYVDSINVTGDKCGA